MSVFRRFLHSVLASAERDLDSVENLLSHGEGYDRKVRLLAYAGYRNERSARIKGRIVRYEKPLDAGEGLLTRLRAMLEIYNSNELPGIEVRCEGYGRTASCTTDHEGYFSFDLDLSSPLPEQTKWENVLLSTPGRQASRH